MKLVILLLFAAALAARAEAPKGTVLFVCEHGAAKSVVAAAHFNRLAAERGLPYRAVSRGTAPDAAMAPPAVQGLQGDGLRPDDPAPVQLRQSDLDAAARVVTFCELPGDLASRSPAERWEVPPVSAGYAASRDALLARIEKMLSELAAQGPARR